MKKIYALVLMLALLLVTFSGCVENDPLLGKWYYRGDIGPRVNGFLAEGSQEVADRMVGQSFYVMFEVTFYADGTYQILPDMDSFAQSYQQYHLALEQAIWSHLQADHRAKHPEISLEDHLQGLGITREELLLEAMGQSFSEELQIYLALPQEGYYSQESGKLYFQNDMPADSTCDYHKFCVQGKKDSQLCLEPGQYQEPDTAAHYENILPLTLQREKP